MISTDGKISTDGNVSPAENDLCLTMAVRVKKLRGCTLVNKANHVLGYVKRATAGRSWEVIRPLTRCW